MTDQQIAKLEKAKMVSDFIQAYDNEELKRDFHVCDTETKLGTIFQTYNEAHKVKAGEELVVAGYIGLYGAIWLGEHCREHLLKRLPAAFLRDLDELKRHIGFTIQIPASDDSHDRNTIPSDVCAIYQKLITEYDISASYTIGDGGINRPLFQLGKDTNLGYEITYTDLPMKQEIIEVCEQFDMDPWQLYSGGCALFVTSQGNALVRALTKAHIPSAVVGFMTKDKKKMVCHQGVESLVNRPQPDELLKIMKEIYL